MAKVYLNVTISENVLKIIIFIIIFNNLACYYSCCSCLCACFRSRLNRKESLVHKTNFISVCLLGCNRKPFFILKFIWLFFGWNTLMRMVNFRKWKDPDLIQRIIQNVTLIKLFLIFNLHFYAVTIESHK